MTSAAEGAENFFFCIQIGQFLHFTESMANNDFSDPCQRADSPNRISFLADFWVWVTFEARGSVSVGFWGSCQLSPFWGRGGLARGLYRPPHFNCKLGCPRQTSMYNRYGPWRCHDSAP